MSTRSMRCVLAVCTVTLFAGALAARPARADTPDERRALDEAHAVLVRIGAAEPYRATDPAVLARARAERVSGDAIASWLARIEASCLASDARCSAAPVPAQDVRGRTVDALLALLGRLGAARDAPLLVRLDTRGVLAAHTALAQLLEDGMTASLAPCAPPSATEVTAARATLADFAAVRVRAGRLVAEWPTASELDDLAYFAAATATQGPEVGAAADDGAACAPGTPVDPDRVRDLQRFDRAQLEGDLPAVARWGTAYLATYGFPGHVCVDASAPFAWGGARYSYVMRDLARADELLGRYDDAAALYRRANPGGGACGTGVSYVWTLQVQGAIRAAERAGRCRDAVAERLLAIDGEASDHGPYGLARLRDAGFDLARLYRGALVTLDRDAPRADLERAFAAAPAPLSALATHRLATHGAEDSARRVFALEGLADTEGRAALPTLLAAATGHAGAAARTHALATLAELARRPPSDPCSPTRITEGFGSSEWQRRVHALGAQCATALRAPEADALATALAPALDDPEPTVREAAAHALGAIASPSSVPALTRAQRDPYAADGQMCDADPHGQMVNCHVPYPVRDAATEALARIAQFASHRP